MTDDTEQYFDEALYTGENKPIKQYLNTDDTNCRAH